MTSSVNPTSVNPTDPTNPSAKSTDDISTEQRLIRRLERERRARKEAEALLEQKSRALYQAQGELEVRVAERTQALQTANEQLEAEIQNRQQILYELKRAQRDAEQANRAKSVFLANMSHELRTPLNAIIGYSELLQDEMTSAGHPALVDDLQRILSAGRHLLSLINDILDFSKIEAGKVTVFRDEFSLSQLIHEVEATMAPLIRENDNTLVIQTPVDLDLSTDMTKLRQILYNLLSNAAKFTQSGQITLRAAPEPDDAPDDAPTWIIFSVQDTGIGMSQTELAHIFNPFDQAERSTSHRFGGTGLGLTINRHFCTMMGGTLDVVSEQGVGSTFTARLPIRLPDQLTN